MGLFTSKIAAGIVLGGFTLAGAGRIYRYRYAAAGY